MNKNIILFILIISASCFASNKLEYESSNLKSMPLDLMQSINQSLNDLNYKLVFTRAGGSKLLRVNMMYSDSFLSSKIIIKYKTKGAYKLNKEYKVSKGYLYHTKLDDNDSAIYFENLSRKQRKEIIQKLRTNKKTVYNFSIFPKAHADCVSSLSGMPDISLDTKIASSSAGAVFSECMSGLLEGAEESTVGMVSSIWDEISSESKKLWDNPSKRLSEYWGFVSEGAEALWSFTKTLGELFINPSLAMTTLKSKFGEIGQFFVDAYNNVAAMPMADKASLFCNILGSIGVDVLISAITVGAGSGKLGITIARILLKLKKIARTVGKGLKVSYKVLENFSDKVLDDIQLIIQSGNKNKLQMRMREVGCAI